MNYLELVRELARETGTMKNADPQNETIDSIEVEGTPHLEKLKRWVAKSWTSIQLEANWGFRRLPGTLNLTEGDKEYDLSTPLPLLMEVMPYVEPFDQRWIRIADRHAVFFTHWEDWAGAEERLTFTPARPKWFTIKPDRTLVVTPAPDKAYVVTFEYLRKPQALAANSDVPIMPEEFHDLIVYRAMRKYAAYDEAAAQYPRAQIDYKELQMRLRNDQLPTCRVKGSAS